MASLGSNPFLAGGSEIRSAQYTPDEIQRMVSLLDNYFRKNHTKTYALREAMKHIPELSSILWNDNLRQVAHGFATNAFVCKSIYFDKTPETNWYVGWHQDISIHVSEKIPAPGFDGWTQKEGIIGVCAPTDVLRQMLTIRIHLDDATKDNGALHVVPGSHVRVLSPTEIEQTVAASASVVCEVEAGGMHIMRPLLLHRSSKATSERRRRVIHLEFTPQELPHGLRWAEKEYWY